MIMIIITVVDIFLLKLQRFAMPNASGNSTRIIVIVLVIVITINHTIITGNFIITVLHTAPLLGLQLSHQRLFAIHVFMCMLLLLALVIVVH